MFPFAVAVFCSTSAFIMALFISITTTRFPGLLGSFLPTLPSIVIPACVGLALTTALTSSPAYSLSLSCFSSSVGQLLDIVFLVVWQIMPKIEWWRRKFGTWMGSAHELAVLLTMAVLGWFACAIGVVYVINALVMHMSIPIELVGLGTWAMSLAIALAVLFTRYVPTPPQSRKINYPLTFGRSLLSSLVVFSSLTLSGWNDIASGMATIFPTVFLTSLIALRMGEGSGIVQLREAKGEVASQMLGSLAVPAFAMLFAVLYPLCERWVGIDPQTAYYTASVDKTAGAITLAVLFAELLSVLFVSLPVYMLLQWRTRLAREHIAILARLRTAQDGGGEASGAMGGGGTESRFGMGTGGGGGGGGGAGIRGSSPLMLPHSWAETEDDLRAMHLEAQLVPDSDLRSNPRGRLMDAEVAEVELSLVERDQNWRDAEIVRR